MLYRGLDSMTPLQYFGLLEFQCQINPCFFRTLSFYNLALAFLDRLEKFDQLGFSSRSAELGRVDSYVGRVPDNRLLALGCHNPFNSRVAGFTKLIAY